MGTTAKNTRTRIALEQLGKYYDVAGEPINISAIIKTSKVVNKYVGLTPEDTQLAEATQKEILTSLAEDSKQNLIKTRDILGAFYGQGTTIPTVQCLRNLDVSLSVGNVKIPGRSNIGENGEVPASNAGVLSLIPFDKASGDLTEKSISVPVGSSEHETEGGTNEENTIIIPQAATSCLVRQGQNPITGVYKPKEGDFYTLQGDALNPNAVPKSTPTPVHAILNYLVSAAPTVTNSDLTTILANGVPPLEWSRCIPYLEVMIASESGVRKIATQFLNPDADSEHSEGDAHVSAVVGSDDPKPADQVIDRGDDSTYSVLGSMDVFTMPQTLTNRKHIDPFRPLASLESFTNTLSGFIPTSSDPAITPTIKDQKATLRLRIHHPSYLDELAPLVKPSHTGTTKIVVTYGWAHPDGITAGSRPSDENMSARWGDLLNSCRTTEVFSILNSRISFTDSNEVQVDVEMSQSSTSQELVEKMVNASSVGVPAREIDGILDQAIDTFALNLADSTNSRNYNFNYKMFQSRLKKDEMLSKESGDKLKEYIAAVNDYVKANRRKKGPSVYGKNMNQVGVKFLSDLFTQTFGKGNASAFLSAAKQSNPSYTSSALLAGLSKVADPFLPVCGEEKHVPQPQITIKRLKTNPAKNTYISFGKIMTYFVGSALTKLDGYSEVQMIFHPFNRDAGAAHYYTVASYPIVRSEFDNWFKDYVKREGFISTQRFIDAVVSRFIHVRGQGLGYGIKNVKDAKRQKNLAKAYGYTDPGELAFSPKFVNPKIEVTSRSALPRNTLSEVGASTPEDTINPSKKPVLRIEFSDGELSSLGGFLNEMSDSLTHGGAFPKRARRPGVQANDAGKKFQLGVIHDADVELYVHHLETNLKILKPAPNKGSDEFKAIVEEIKANAGNEKPIKNVDQLLEKIFEQFYRVDVSRKGTSTREAIKAAASSSVPGSIIYGALGTAITSAAVQTSQDQRFINLALMDRRTDEQKKDDKRAGIEPMKLAVLPLELDLTFLGQPFIYPGQEYFVDLKTGTNIDQMYRVMSVDHILESGKYETRAKLTPSHGGPRYASSKDSVSSFLAGRLLALAD